jgi:hypothetical protein
VTKPGFVTRTRKLELRDQNTDLTPELSSCHIQLAHPVWCRRLHQAAPWHSTAISSVTTHEENPMIFSWKAQKELSEKRKSKTFELTDEIVDLAMNIWGGEPL